MASTGPKLPRAMPKNFGRFDETTTSQTLQSLDDLLGEDPKISAERRADERAKEAFEASEKKKQLKEKTKKMYEKRFERFELGGETVDVGAKVTSGVFRGVYTAERD